MDKNAIKDWIERVRHDEEDLAREEIDRVRAMSIDERIDLIHRVLRAGLALWAANPNRERIQALRDAEHDRLAEIMRQVGDKAA